MKATYQAIEDLIEKHEQLAADFRFARVAADRNGQAEAVLAGSRAIRRHEDIALNIRRIRDEALARVLDQAYGIQGRNAQEDPAAEGEAGARADNAAGL